MAGGVLVTCLVALAVVEATQQEVRLASQGEEGAVVPTLASVPHLSQVAGWEGVGGYPGEVEEGGEVAMAWLASLVDSTVELGQVVEDVVKEVWEDSWEVADDGIEEMKDSLEGGLEMMKKMSHELEDSWEYADDGFEEMRDSMEYGMEEGLEGVAEVATAVERHSRSLASSLWSLYGATTFAGANRRFHWIKEQVKVNLTGYMTLCPMFPFSCAPCPLPALLCRLCCPSTTATTPLPFADDDAAWPAAANLLPSWVDASLWWSGLRAVYQTWLAPRQQRISGYVRHTEVVAAIRNFVWARGGAEVQGEVLRRPASVCGYYRAEAPEGRVVGGREVEVEGRYPYQLSLATGFLDLFYQHHCGAAVVSTRWAVTAAHCVRELAGQQLYVMGDFLTIASSRETAQIRWVDRVEVHPRFVAAMYEQDIALMHLEEPLTFTPSLLPVCLPPPSHQKPRTYQVGSTTVTSGPPDHLAVTWLQGEVGTLTGWGRQWDEGPLARQLETVDLPIVSNRQCMQWYNRWAPLPPLGRRSGSRQLIREETFLCAGWREGSRDACSGDSGGPLVVYRCTVCNWCMVGLVAGHQQLVLLVHGAPGTWGAR